MKCRTKHSLTKDQENRKSGSEDYEAYLVEQETWR